MPNGSAALHLIEPALAVAPSNGVPVSGPKPAAATEIELGEAVASATGAFCFMLDEYQNGGVTDKTRLAIGERVGRVAMMQLSYELGDDDDFTRRARGASKPILRECFDTDYFKRYSPEQGDQAIDFYLTELLAVVSRVVAAERKFVAAMAN